MKTIDERYLCGAGHARASWRPPSDRTEWRVWVTWLMCLFLFLGASVTVILLFNKGFSPRDTTAQMEQIAKRLERMKTIRPEVAQVIGTLISQPRYDCDRVPCAQDLSERNRAVRARLTSMLAESRPKAATFPLSVSRAELRIGPKD
jgi:hypothetical protein